MAKKLRIMLKDTAEIKARETARAEIKTLVELLALVGVALFGVLAFIGLLTSIVGYGEECHAANVVCSHDNMNVSSQTRAEKDFFSGKWSCIKIVCSGGYFKDGKYVGRSCRDVKVGEI